MPPAAYFRSIPYGETSESRFAYCFGIGPVTTDPPYTILGDTFMTAAYVIFDRQMMRVGFAEPSQFPSDGSSLPPPITGAPWFSTGNTLLYLLLVIVSAGLWWWYVEPASSCCEGEDAATDPLLPPGEGGQYGAI